MRLCVASRAQIILKYQSSYKFGVVEAAARQACNLQVSLRVRLTIMRRFTDRTGNRIMAAFAVGNSEILDFGFQVELIEMTMDCDPNLNTGAEAAKKNLAA